MRHLTGTTLLEDNAIANNNNNLYELKMAFENMDEDQSVCKNDRRDTGDHHIHLKPWRWICKHKALLFVLLAAFCSALESILVRYTTCYVHAMLVSFARYTLSLPLPVSALVYSGMSPKPESKSIFFFLITRGLVGTVAIMSFYFALYFTDVGNATAITFGSPVFVVFFSRIMLKETIGLIDAVLALVVICGVFLISQPPFLFGGGKEGNTSWEVIGALISLCSCISISLAVTLCARLGQLHVNTFKTVFYYAVIASLVSSIVTTILNVWSLPPCGSVRYALVGIAFLSCCNQTLQTYSLTKEAPVLVAIVRTNEVIFAYVLDFIFFDTSPGVVPLIGAGLILSGSIIASWRKMRLAKTINVTNQRTTEITSS